MPRRCRPAFVTLHLFRNQIVTYPRRRPSIRTLIRRIESLGYEVFPIPPDFRWSGTPEEFWSIVATIFLGDIDDSRQLLLIVPLPRRLCRLTRSGAFLAYDDEGYDDEYDAEGPSLGR